MPFGPVDPDLNLVDLEARVLQRWADHAVVEQVRQLRKDSPPWIFYEGPPTANGRPGIHHVWARVFKDLYPRFQTMRGKRVPRKGGWDCHGLPVELEIEKELGLQSKHDIEAYGIERFNDKCRESVQRYVEDWTKLTERSGVWIDTADAYWTLSNDYIESVWWLLRQMWDQDLLYEGHRVTPYCSRCGTALSSHELGQPGAYRDVEDPSIYVRFPLVDRDADLLVWTTTPWTLISNVAAAVGADIDYVRVPASVFGVEGRDLILAAARLPEGADSAVVERIAGRALVGAKYQRPFEYLAVDDPDEADRSWRVLAADFVSTEDGSGIVHLAPAFGDDDARACREHRLPVLNPVNADGGFDDRVPLWRGLFVKEADPGIIADLDARGLLVREQPYLHSYPHCWRCGTPLIYWAKTSWFIRTSEQRELLLRENERIGWQPPNIKHGRFGNWLEGNVDWALSRDRYWGTPLPIWRCGACGHDTCVGSVAELSSLAGRDLSDLDLHRPFVDEVTFPCTRDGCAGTAHRLEPVLDAWFDSGSMPSAQFHYPFENTTTFEQSFPADFICEAIDQTRGWFYSLLAVNALVFGATPYKNVVCLGLIVDEQGQKMSKSRGNVIDPWDIFGTQGADALRWYFFAHQPPWTSIRYNEQAIKDSIPEFLLRLWNVFTFFVIYANLDQFDPGQRLSGQVGQLDHEVLARGRGFRPVAQRSELDRWILSELAATSEAVVQRMDQYDSYSACQSLHGFVDALSNWYVRRSRGRFWSSDRLAPDKLDAYWTLYECLLTTSRLVAPFVPFLAEHLWRNLVHPFGTRATESVHLCDYPLAHHEHIDPLLASRMELVRQIVSLGQGRSRSGIG